MNTSYAQPNGRRADRRGSLAALGLLLLAGCGGELGHSARPAHLSVLQLSTKPTRQIGIVEGDSDYVFGSIASVRHLSSGNLVVSDAMADEILEYSPNGTFVRRIGRKGDGPGEFRGLSHLYVTAGDSILAEDGLRGTVAVFDSAGRFVRQVPGSSLSGDDRFALDVWLYGRFWVDGALKAAERARVRTVLDRLPPPVSAPDYRYVRVDDSGRLWIREPGVSAGDRYMWTLLGADGRPSASLAIPVRFDPQEIRRHEITGRWRGENDVNFVRTYTFSETGQVRATPAWLVEPPPASAPPEDQRQFLAAVRSAIKNMATAEEVHYADAGSYTDQVDSLTALQPNPKVQVDIVQASSRGWSAVFTHPGLDRICGLTYGMTGPPGWMPGTLMCGAAAGADSTSSPN